MVDHSGRGHRVLKHISADELQRIVDEQPLKEKLELTAYPH